MASNVDRVLQSLQKTKKPVEDPVPEVPEEEMEDEVEEEEEEEEVKPIVKKVKPVKVEEVKPEETKPEVLTYEQELALLGDERLFRHELLSKIERLISVFNKQ